MILQVARAWRMSEVVTTNVCVDEYLTFGYCREFEKEFAIHIPDGIIIMIVKYGDSKLVCLKVMFADDQTGSIDVDKFKFACFPSDYTIKQLADDVKFILNSIY